MIIFFSLTIQKISKEVESNIDEMINYTNYNWYSTSTHDLDKLLYNNTIIRVTNRLIRNSQDKEMTINDSRCLKYWK